MCARRTEARRVCAPLIDRLAMPTAVRVSPKRH